MEEYRIGAGDQLSINVYGEPDLSIKEIRVGHSGMVSYPLIGDVKVSGFTAGELESHITKLLLDGFLLKPEVNVSILKYRMFYVHGQVRKPGGYQYVEGLTAEKAIALAGGFTERASENKIDLIREKGPRDKPERITMSEKVMPGDVVMVGESIF